MWYRDTPTTLAMSSSEILRAKWLSISPECPAHRVHVGYLIGPHQNLDSEARVQREGGNIDVFDVVARLRVPLLLRPLQGLLGVFLREPTPGILVTTERPLSVQRFTGAHELGHFELNHRPSFDDETILRRSPLVSRPDDDLQEVEADAFAIGFLIPRWLVALHCERQGWSTTELRRADIIYQLSLRIGASYEATCWTLVRYKLLTMDLARRRSSLGS